MHSDRLDAALGFTFCGPTIVSKANRSERGGHKPNVQCPVFDHPANENVNVPFLRLVEKRVGVTGHLVTARWWEREEHGERG
jgi:hypothetical protein